MRTTAKKDGNHYVINGTKTFITNGQNADLILVCLKTDTEVDPACKGVSIVLVEADREGFERGRNLDKIGLDDADTSAERRVGKGCVTTCISRMSTGQ